MIPTYTQTDRLITIESPLGTDVLLLERFDMREALSEPFEAELALLSPRDDIAAAEIVGKTVDFSLELADGSKRWFNGYVVRFTRGDPGSRDLRYYRATVRPWLWFLTRTADCRIFQNKTVPDIISAVFDELGFTDYTTANIHGTHPEREYIVQYRETDFAFVSRLMEEEGIYYSFEHERGRHTMVLADDIRGYRPCPENQIDFSSGDFTPNHINSLTHGFAFRSGKWSQNDYNFKQPSANLRTNSNTVVDLPKVSEYELYDYPGRYDNKGFGTDLTKLRMEEVEVDYEVTEGASACRTLHPAGKFTLKRHVAASEENQNYVLTAVEHTAVNQTYLDGSASITHYSNTFTCIPDSTAFRPPRETPKPVISGLQTAVVVGPSGEEIYTDDDGYGRIKVQFHWDRYGQKDERSSCWIRVAHDIAGRQWGSFYLPRIGQEVVVAFLEGDPDRPLVIGSVYNAENMPPFPLPANKTQTGYRTRSSQGGGSSNFNELRFEDKTGQEEVYFHAEKDYNRVVENDDSLDVGNDQTIVVKNNRSETITQGSETVDINQGSRTHTIKMGNDSLDVKMGNRSVNVGQNLTVEAGMSIELKVGANTIKIDHTGITINGLMVKINGSAMTEVKSGGMVMVQGPLVKIN